MNRWIGITAILSMVLWASLLVSPSPIKLVPGDRIEPDRIPVGGDFSVWRNFDVTRASHILITRTLEQGDCRVACEVFELSTGSSFLEAGHYRNREKNHTAPRRAQPGKYKFKTVLHWSDRIGYRHSVVLPDLDIEIIEQKP